MLEMGDIFELQNGHQVYIELPYHFLFDNEVGVFDKLATATVTVGEDYRGLSTDWLRGRYVVLSTAMTGGGTGHGPHDVFPDGHEVVAEKLQKSTFNSRWTVRFFQSGCFTAMNPDIKAEGKATPTWNEVTDE